MSAPHQPDAPDAGDRTRRQPRLGLRGLLVLVAVIPLVGLAVLAAISAVDHWSNRQSAVSAAEQTERLDRLVAMRAAISDEQAHSIGVQLAGAFGIDLDESEVGGVDLLEGMEDARTAVDAIALPSESVSLEDARGELETFRTRLDQQEADFINVVEGFEPITSLLEGSIDDQLDQIVDTIVGARLPGRIMERLAALKVSLDAFDQLGTMNTRATQIVVGSEFLPELLTSQAELELVESSIRFDAAVEAAMATEGLPVAEAWQEFLDDPAAQRTQGLIEAAVRQSLGIAQEQIVPGALTDAFSDGTRWLDLINEALQTASRDLRESARSQASAETTGMVWRLGSTAILTVIALVVALRVAGGLIRPVQRIAAAANRIKEGELEVDPVELSGPRELASTADAFNDMMSTLSEVERRAILLAEEPDDLSLSIPLPGRVGQALQGALDRLRVSIRLAEERRAELERVATHDGLTGLVNRTAALDAVGRELAQARRDGTRTFALFIDLDGLKPINDNHGHDAGDDAIRLTADALRVQTRDADVVARLGGDEFLVAGRVDQDAVEVEALAQRIVAAVAAQRVRVLGGEIPLRCSAGIAITEPGTPDQSVDDLVQAADDALYRAKRAGGNHATWRSALG